ncbi:MAG: hypothetical protein ACEPOW_13920 [Bacteroidales bacterium]
MQTINEEVREYLERTFGNVTKIRQFESGFKMNLPKLSKSDLQLLDSIPANVDIEVKRSGTGLVVIIS